MSGASTARALPQIGEVWWVGFSTRAGSHEQGGRRPAVIVQVPTATLPTILVVPLTTQLAALRFPGTMVVEPDATNGLPRRSVALVFQMTAVDARRLEARCGDLIGEQLQAIWSLLDELMGRQAPLTNATIEDRDDQPELPAG